MRVISTTDLSHYGNDCYINRSVTLMEQFGLYTVVVCQKITGWFKDDYVGADYISTNYDDAIKAYKDYGGIIND
jgi:hypothetical protein